MLKIIGWILKLTVFAALILVLGNWFHWGGKTISDQVKTQMSHAENLGIVENVKGWATRITSPKNEIKKSNRPQAPGESSRSTVKEKEKNKTTQEILPSERQKLRALIRELNSSAHGQN